MNKNFPYVTLLIVVKNEREYIDRSLNSLLNQTYAKEKTEIIIVDGMSTDGTREWLKNRVKELQEKGISIKLLDNPKHILASGWNIGIKNANGDIVCRIDAHSEICPHYVKKGINELLKRKNENVICVGGVLENIGSGVTGKTIANLFSSRFGIGNSGFRIIIDKPKFTDTAVFGLYWKWIFNKIGYFDESLERNQDISLHVRILKNGYKFVTHPDMKINYYVRNTISKLIKKAFGDGYWTIYSQKSYLRHKIPLFFILYLISIPFILLPAFYYLSSFWCYLYLLPCIFYIFLSIFFSIKDGKSYSRFLLPFFFIIFHISYGLGSFKGVVDKLILNKIK